MEQKRYYCCYASATSEEKLKDFGMKLLQEGFKSTEHFGPDNFLIQSSKACLSVDRCSGENIPFSFSVSLTVFNAPLSSSKEQWREVAFAHTISRQLKATTYCNVPEEIRKEQNDFYQICFSWKEDQFLTELVELDDINSNTVSEISRRNIELVHQAYNDVLISEQ